MKKITKLTKRMIALTGTLAIREPKCKHFWMFVVHLYTFFIWNRWIGFAWYKPFFCLSLPFYLYLHRPHLSFFHYVANENNNAQKCISMWYNKQNVFQ